MQVKKQFGLAASAFRKAMEIADTHLGSGHRRAIQSKLYYWEAMAQSGKSFLVLEPLKTQQKLIQEKFGSSHPFSIKSSLLLGKTLMDLGLRKDGLEILKTTWETCQSDVEDLEIFKWDAALTYGYHLAMSNQREIAIPLLELAATEFEKRKGKTFYKTILSNLRLADAKFFLAYKNGNPEVFAEVKQIAEANFPLAVAHVGPDSDESFKLDELLARSIFETGTPEEGANGFSRLIQNTAQNFGPNSNQYVECLLQSSLAFAKLEKHDLAEQNLANATQIILDNPNQVVFNPNYLTGATVYRIRSMLAQEKLQQVIELSEQAEIRKAFPPVGLFEKIANAELKISSEPEKAKKELESVLKSRLPGQWVKTYAQLLIAEVDAGAGRTESARKWLKSVPIEAVNQNGGLNWLVKRLKQLEKSLADEKEDE